MWCTRHGGKRGNERKRGNLGKKVAVCRKNLEADFELDSTFSCFLITNPSVGNWKGFGIYSGGFFGRLPTNDENVAQGATLEKILSSAGRALRRTIFTFKARRDTERTTVIRCFARN